MSVTINGKTVSDRSWVKPRNYTEMILQTKELKNEVKYQLNTIVQDRMREEAHEKEAERQRAEQEKVGFSKDLAYGMGGQIVNYL